MRAGAGRDEPIVEQVRQIEVAQVVDPEGQLESLRRGGPLRPDATGVVHEHVEAIEGSLELGRALADRGQIGEVECGDVDVVVPGAFLHLRGCGLGLRLVATGEHRGGSHGREPDGGLLADSDVRAGDHDHLAVHTRLPSPDRARRPRSPAPSGVATVAVMRRYLGVFLAVALVIAATAFAVARPAADDATTPDRERRAGRAPPVATDPVAEVEARARALDRSSVRGGPEPGAAVGRRTPRSGRRPDPLPRAIPASRRMPPRSRSGSTATARS